MQLVAARSVVLSANGAHPIVHEKRHHPRVRIEAEVSCELQDGSIVSGQMTDVSVGGCFVASEAHPPLNTPITVVVRLPGASAVSRLPATVRWTKPEGFGVQFGLLGALETHLLANLMRQ